MRTEEQVAMMPEEYQNRSVAESSLWPFLQEVERVFGCDASLLLLDESNHAIKEVISDQASAERLHVIRQASGELDYLFETFKVQGYYLTDNLANDGQFPSIIRSLLPQVGKAAVIVPLGKPSTLLLLTRNEPFVVGSLFPLISYVIQLSKQLLQLEQQTSSEIQSRPSQPWLLEMLNDIPTPVLVAQQDNKIVYMNRHASELFNSLPEDSSGKRRAAELNSFLFTTFLSSFFLSDTSLAGRELTLVDTIEGSEYLFEVLCRPVSGQNATSLICCVFIDVTYTRLVQEEARHNLSKLREANETMRDERDRLNTILQSVPDPIIVASPSNEPMLMNTPAEMLLQPMAGSQDETEAAVLANRGKLFSFLSKAQLDSSNGPSRSEFSMVNPSSNEQISVQATANAIRNRMQEVSAIVCVVHDLTEVKELEQRRVEQQLFEAQKLAAVARLTAALAHEVNNPLESIKNSLHLIAAKEHADSPSRKFVEIALTETDRLSRLVRQMLGAYRPTEKKERIDIAPLVESTFVLLQHQFRLKQVRIKSDVRPNLPSITASADQLKQVFINLLLNALDATDKGGTVTVAVGTADKARSNGKIVRGRFLSVEVQDTGKGIPEDVVPHLFDAFFSTKPIGTGTGLGLWIVQDIINRHGGHIDVRSTIGQGTTFNVLLPVG